MPKFLSRYATYLLLITVGLISTGNMALTDFIGDDIGRILVRENIFKQGLSFTLNEVLSDRPLLMLTIWLNYNFGGMSAFGYKVVNVLLHLACGLAFYRLLREITASNKQGQALSLISAAVFLAHPINNQAVNSVIQRGILLSSFFAALSAILFLKALKNEFRRDHYLFSIFLFLLALISKPNTVALPFLILVIALYLGRASAKSVLKLLTPFFALMLLPAVFYLTGENLQYRGPSSLEYLHIQTRVVFFYFDKYFLPLDLHYFYDFNNDVASLIENDYTGFAIFHAGLIAAGFFLLVRKQIEGLFVILGYLCLMPESSLFSIMHPAFDHRNYMAILFFSAAFFALIFRTGAKLKNSQRFTYAFAGLIVTILMYLNFSYTQKISTYEKWIFYNLEKNPTYSNFYTYVIGTELARGNYSLAEKFTNEALRHNSTDRELYFYRSFSRFPNLSSAEKLAFLQEAYSYAFSKGFNRFTFNYFEYLLSRELPALLPEKESLYRMNTFYLSFSGVVFMHNSEKELLARVEKNFFDILKINNRETPNPARFFEDIELNDAFISLRSLLALDYYFGHSGIDVDAYENILKTHYSKEKGAQEILQWLGSVKSEKGKPL